MQDVNEPIHMIRYTITKAGVSATFRYQMMEGEEGRQTFRVP